MIDLVHIHSPISISLVTSSKQPPTYISSHITSNPLRTVVVVVMMVVFRDGLGLGLRLRLGEVFRRANDDGDGAVDDDDDDDDRE